MPRKKPGTGGTSKAPASFSPAFISIVETIALHARTRPSDPAFADHERTLSWQQFDRDVNRVGNAVLAAGLRKGDCVGVLGGNSLWAYTVIFGVMRAGGVVCPLSPLLTPQLLADLIADCGAGLLFVQEDYRQLGRDFQARCGDLRLIFERGADPSEDFRRQVAASSSDNPNIALAPDDRCNVIYSSGTTGRPKGIVHTHGARVAFATQIGLGLRFHSRSRTLLSTSSSSNGTWMVMLPTVMLGGATLVTGPFSVAGILSAIERHRPTHAFIVPTQAREILDDPAHLGTDFKRFECIVTAGAPMPDGVKKRMRDLTGERLYELWGFTESVGTIISPAEMAQRPHSVGRAWHLSDLRIIDSDGADISGHGTGEIAGRTTSMMEGYLNRPDANAEIVWRDDQGKVFFRTGDIGELDGDGYLTLRGRAKDMIVSGGQNVFPVDIEAVLLRHEAVQDAAVVGIDDHKWGETPVAFVIPRPGCPVDAEQLKSWSNSQLAKFQRLTDLVILSSDFPRNTLGKVLKNDLKTGYRRRDARGGATP
jgi:long-chain acyl-CoA synthetase